MKKSKIVISVIILILIVVLSLMCIFMNKSTFIKQFKGNNDNLNAGTAKEITLNANGGTGGTSKIYLSGAKMYTDIDLKNQITSITIPTRSGYIFKGYYVTYLSTEYLIINADGTATSDIGICNMSSDTLTAKWQQKVAIELTLNANGGTGGTNKVYASNNGKMYADINLDNEIAKITIPTRSGYIFKGYYTTYSNNEVEVIKADGTATNNINMFGSTNATRTLTAKWESNGAKALTLNANGGTGGTSKIYLSGAKMYTDIDLKNQITSITIPTRSGYIFKGYYVTYLSTEYLIINADGTATSDIGICNMSSDTLTAKWQQKVAIELTLNANGGTGGTNKVYASNNGKMYADINLDNEIAKITIPTRSGYIFKGYYTTYSNSEVEVIQADGTATNNINMFGSTNATRTLTAKWESNGAIELTLNADGGTGGTSKIYIKGVNMYTDIDLKNQITSITTPTRSGYIFKGYYTTYSEKEYLIINADGTATSDIGICNMPSVSRTLTAKWQLDCQIITLDKNGGTGGTSTLYYKNADTLYTDEICSSQLTAITKPTKSGYKFLGYYYTYQGNEQQIITSEGKYVGSSSFATYLFNVIKGDITLTAKWQLNGIELILDANGGTGGTNKVYASNNGKMYADINLDNEIAKITIPTRSGYIFKGYYTTYSNSEVEVIQADGTATNNINMFGSTNATRTLTAKWESNGAIELTLNADGGTGGTSKIYIKGVNMYTDIDLKNQITSITTPTRSGYIFKGYYTTYSEKEYLIINADGTATSDIGICNMPSVSRTLTAKWQLDCQIITLDKNGGTGGTSTLYYKNADTLYTDEICSSQLTAITKPTKSGYKFLGYYYTYQGNEQQIITSEGKYVGSSSFATYLFNVIKGDITLTAKWQLNGIELILDANGGTGGTNKVYASNNGKMYADTNLDNEIAKITIPTKSGYIFKGYYTTYSNSEVEVIQADGTATNNINMFGSTNATRTLTAKWESNGAIELTLNADGGTGGTSKLYTKSGKMYTDIDLKNEITEITIPTKSGYIFKGYYTTYSNNEIEVIQADGTATNNINMFGSTSATRTLTAKWESNGAIELTLNADGGTGGTSKLYTKSGKMYTDIDLKNEITEITIPTKSGYIFKGYYTTYSNNEIEVIQADGTATNNINMFGSTSATRTLTAKWESNGAIELTLNADGGTGGTSKLYTKSGKMYTDIDLKNEITEITIPTKSGYIFKGYYTTYSNNEIEVIQADGTATNNINMFGSTSATRTLTAKWESNGAIELTLNANGGTGGTSKLYTKSGKMYTDIDLENEITEITIPTRSGYIFKGYYTTYSNNEIEVIQADGTATNNINMFAVTNASRTLTAKWIENTYTITIQPNGETITGKEGETINIASYVKRPTLTFDYGYDSKISSITPGAKIECTTGKINIKSEEEIMYTVGGSDATVTININSITLETPESREGYEFEGWYTEKENGSKVGNAGDIYDITANTTIYAHWKSTSEENIPVESIELDKNTAEIYIGGTVVVKATVKPDNSTNKNVRYTSSDEDIATVSQAGIITGKKAGAVTITVTTEDGNKTAECTIIVKDKNSENPEDPNDSDKTEPIIDKVEVGKDQDGNNILYITATDGESGISKVVVNGNDITEQVTEDGKFYCILNKDGEYEIYIEDRAGNSVSKFLTWKTPSSDNDDNNSGNKDDDNSNNDNNDNNKDNNNEKPGDNNSNNNSSNSINNNSTGNNYGNSNNIGTNNSKNQISGSTSNDSTTANKVLPKTGNIAWIVSVVGIIAIGIISIIKYKKTDIK